MRLSILTLFLSTCLLCACEKKNGAWKNEQIDADVKKKLHAINDEVFSDLKKNRYLHLEYNLSLEMITNADTKHSAEVLGYELRDNNYKLFDEYYLVHEPEHIDTVRNRNRGINNYDLLSYAVTRQMYTVFFVERNGANRKMLTMVYCKFNYGWKLYHWDIRPYTFNGHTAFELLEIAKQQIAKGYVADSELTMQLAASCLRPSDVVKYANDSSFVSTYNRFIKKAHEVQKFPVALNDVSTKPEVLGVYSQNTPDGYYPMIGYLSKIKLSDTMALRSENQEVMKTIGKTLPGIDKDKKMLFHRVYNKVSTKDSMQAYFDIRTDL